jgi:hypothetical protein
MIQSGQFYEETFICASSASLASNQYYIVAATTTTTSGGRPGVVLCASSTNGTAGAMGVNQGTPAVSQATPVRMFGMGTSKIVATSTGSVALGAPVCCSTLGTAMTADTTGQTVIGKALSASTGASGVQIEVLLNGPFMFTGSTA